MRGDDMASGLPGGTVTFLFTDIEGSTRLWDAFPDEMRQALSMHNRVVADAVEANGGHLVKNTGDGMFAAFSSAPAAVSQRKALVSGLTYKLSNGMPGRGRRDVLAFR